MPHSLAARRARRHRLPLIAIMAMIGAAITPVAAAPQAPAPLASVSLQSALDRALLANPTITAARLQRAVDAAGVGVARERPNPDVTFEAAKDAPRKAFGGSVPIELGGKRQRRIDVAQAGVSAAEADLERVIAEVQNDVRRAYFQAVAADRAVTLAEETRQLAQRARDAAKARADAGDVAQADVAQTDLALGGADDELIGARGEAAATHAELNTLLGQPATTSLTLTDDLLSGPAPTAEAAIAQATHANTAIVAIDRRIEEQTARRDLAKALQSPDVTAGGGVTWDAQPDFSVGWRLNFGVTLPLFTTHRAGVQVEDAELARLRAERDALVATVGGGVVAALARVQAARDRMTHFQNTTLPNITAVERYAQDSYNAGQTPLAALLQALQQTRDSRKVGLQVSLDYQLALADLERAMGVTIK
jgi:cobalt-zinc-cadmium efflux system outer membrane protein